MEKRVAKRLELLTTLFEKEKIDKEVESQNISGKTNVKSKLRVWEKISRKEINKSWGMYDSTSHTVSTRAFTTRFPHRRLLHRKFSQRTAFQRQCRLPY